MPVKQTVILYSRDGCHLCEEAEKTLAKLQQRADFITTTVKIDSDPGLLARYKEEIPVIFIGGRKAFKFKIDERKFLQLLGASHPGSDLP